MRAPMRWLLGVFYALAGMAHLLAPAPFLKIVPDWVPLEEEVIFWTGVAELAGAVALLQSRSSPLRRWGAIGLAAYAVCVFPANINHMLIDMARADGGFGMQYHAPRLLAQPLLVWLALWTGGVTDWPVPRRPIR